ncbi:helix-turn-helix domain-containing protein [Streptococcus anginosus]|uniref:helix-turn-helix domain-containing protein n=1 Tax=Streptococcus anginosus TaxID=1328 RepID=UPI002FD857C9
MPLRHAKRLHLCECYLPYRHKLSPKNFPEWRPYNRISKGEHFFQEYQTESLLNKNLKVSQCWCSLRYCPGVRSKHLLLSTRMPIYEVAQSVGFSNKIYFYDKYRTYFGHFPKDERK